MLTALVRGGSLLLLLVLTALAWLYFHPVLALWLALLALLTYFSPALGVATLFVVISLDMARPTVGGLIVNVSEFQFATVFFAWAASTSNLQKVDWWPLFWGIPFSVAVAISSLLNLTWYKVPFHVIRLSELLIAIFLVSNVFRDIESGRAGSGRSKRSFPSIRTSPDLLVRSAVFGALLMVVGVGLLCGLRNSEGRFFSLFHNPNQFAGYLVLLLPFCLSFWFSSRKKAVRLFWFYSSAIVFLSLLATVSRAAIFGGTLAAILVWFLFHFGILRLLLRRPASCLASNLPRNWRFLMVNLVLGAILVTLGVVHFEMGKEKADLVRVLPRRLLGTAQSFEKYRIPLLESGFRIWQDSPIVGVGPGQYRYRVEELWRSEGTWKEVAKHYPAWSIHVHNLFLQLCIDLGLFGLIAFLLLFLLILRRLFFFCPTSVLAKAGIGLVLGFTLQNLFDVTFPSLALEMGILLGFALAPSLEGRASQDL